MGDPWPPPPADPTRILVEWHDVDHDHVILRMDRTEAEWNGSKPHLGGTITRANPHDHPAHDPAVPTGFTTYLIYRVYLDADDYYIMFCRFLENHWA